MNIAYLISAFTDPQHLKRLINALNTEHAFFFIHIDKKIDIRQFKNICKGSNIFFLPDRVRVYWGTYSQVEFQMRLIKAALSDGHRFGKMFMLSGQDYPLWSNEKIMQWAEDTKGRDMISGICIDSDDVEEKYKQLYRLNRPQTDIKWTSPKMNDITSKALRKTLLMVGSKKPLNLTVDDQLWHLYKGSDYFALTHDTAEYAYKQWRRHKEIKDYFKTSFAPSETCIHTIIFNNPKYSKKGDLHTGNYTTLQALTPLHHIEYDPVIKVWKDGDFDELMDSGKMFARKFESDTSDSLMDIIDKMREDVTTSN